MGWDDIERVTFADIRGRWNVNDSTLRRHRKNGQIVGQQDNTGQWTFDRTAVEAHALAKGWPMQRPAATASDPPPSIDTTDIERRATELAELRAQATVDADTIKRTTAERDQARRDHEHERNRADTAERETIKHRTAAEERAATITKLDKEVAQLRIELDTQRERAAAAEALNTAATPIPEPDQSTKRGRFSTWFFGP